MWKREAHQPFKQPVDGKITTRLPMLLLACVVLWVAAVLSKCLLLEKKSEEEAAVECSLRDVQLPKQRSRPAEVPKPRI